ncbi:MAG: TonB-dependent receptor [candidate division Zixibacteria bacterium]|nr:TonB-dependent receptor [candidate division Zixibacteria bacterium]
MVKLFKSLLIILMTAVLCPFGAFADDTVKSEKLPVFQMDPVVVTGTRSAYILKDSPVETGVITQVEMERAGLKNVADALRLFTGLNVSGGAAFGASQRLTVMHRGLPSQYSLVLIDGKRTKSEHIHTGINLNLLPIEMVDKIEVVKSPLSSVYGSDAIGGVINIITKTASDESIVGGQISYGTFNTREFTAEHGYRIGNAKYLISGKLADSDGIEDNAYKQYNALGRIGYDISSIASINVDGKYYRNEYLHSGNDVEDERIDLGMDISNKFSGVSSLKLETNYTVFTGSRKEATSKTAGFNAIFQSLLANRHNLMVGVEARYEEFERVATPLKDETLLGAYLQDDFRLNDRLSIVASSRVDNHPEFGSVFAPSIAGYFKITEHSKLRGSVGRGFRAPSLQDLYEYHYFHKTYWRDGNPDLEPEYSTNYNLGVEHIFNKSLLARVTGFRIDLENMITAVNTGRLEDDGLPIFQRENVKKAHTQGIETELRFDKSGFGTVLAYTYLDTEDEDGNALSYSPEHGANIQVYYSIKPTGTKILASFEGAWQRYFKTKSGAMKELPDYNIINLNIRQRIIENAHIFLTIGNIFDEEYATYEEGNTSVSFGRTATIGLRFNY